MNVGERLMNNDIEQGVKFLKFANIALGCFLGLMIGLPLFNPSQSLSALYPIALCILGILIGHRRQQSRAFFYLTCLMSLMMCVALASQINQ